LYSVGLHGIHFAQKLGVFQTRPIYTSLKTATCEKQQCFHQHLLTYFSSAKTRLDLQTFLVRIPHKHTVTKPCYLWHESNDVDIQTRSILLWIRTETVV